MSDVAVIGAGVIGLTTAMTLEEARHRVTIYARDFGWRTTSAVAAAVWYPYHIEPEAKVTRWALRTRERLAELANDPASGVSWVELTRAWAGEMPPVPSWAPEILPANDLPPGYRGYRIRVPLIDTSVHLDYLARRFRGRTEVRELASFDDVRADIVVNCTGYGARALCDDDALTPGRGVVVRCERIAPAQHFVCDQEQLTYILSRANDVVLGGIDEADERLAISRGEAESIIARCRAVNPAIAGELREAHAGIRPVRDVGVRLEREGNVIHNYGHGGAGFTVAWGCAEEVLEHLLRE